ncbi:SHOCT domain-containing protein [Salinirubellus sp. GCM10025818]|uniref:SHOCT domain-containing protein n=1 Tax=Salinirubellus TaxID=2162630 RepID=UPI0030CD85B1
MGVLRNLRTDLTGVLAVLILGLGLADLFLNLVPGVDFWVIFVVGYAVVLPLVAIALGEDEDDYGTDREEGDGRKRVEEEEGESPLERLKRRYAAGELSDEEFEHRLERLLETEDEASAAEYLRRERRGREPEET